jgi:hypothetical protein
MRELTADEVTFSLRCEPEDVSVEGNCSAIDPKIDRETEQWIYDELESGNEWAWCHVVVTAEWEGFTGTDGLGCCSYESEEGFREGGYFEDMRLAALDDLNTRLARLDQKLDPLRADKPIVAEGD